MNSMVVLRCQFREWQRKACVPVVVPRLRSRGPANGVAGLQTAGGVAGLQAAGGAAGLQTAGGAARLQVNSPSPQALAGTGQKNFPSLVTISRSPAANWVEGLVAVWNYRRNRSCQS